jgi:DNA polymerase
MRALGLNVVSPQVIINTIRAASVVVASNAPFDQCATALVLGLNIPKERWSCTQARSMRHGLPGSLEHACTVLNLPVGKDMEGNRLAKQVWKPRPTWTKWQGLTLEQRARAKRTDAGPKWFEDAKRIARLCKYNAEDVIASRALDKAVPELEPAEWEIWQHVWRMREIGIPLDMDMVRGAIGLAEESRRQVVERVREYTGGMIQSLNQIQALVAWADRYGYPMPSWDKAAVAEALADPFCPEPVRVVARCRQEAGKGSIAKFETAADCVGPDARLRHQIEYAGTNTLRLAGRGVQPLNLPRPKIMADKSAALADIKAGRPVRVAQWKIDYDPERALHAIRTGDLNLLKNLGDPEEIISDHIRPMIKAPPGKKILSPDLSAIEARGVFWLTSCEKALSAYWRDECLYCQLASTMFGFAVNKKDHPEERQYGKVGILQCGYGSGANRVAMANGLPDDMALKIVGTYRGDYPEVPRTWYDLQDAAISGLRQSGPSVRRRQGSRAFPVRGRMAQNAPAVRNVDVYARRGRG